jgi:YidC/Oxa1 family membrane protein insertase
VKQNPFLSLSLFFKSFQNYRAFNKLTDDQRNIVVYSESGQDWHHFRKIIEELLSNSRSVCYISSDPLDPGLSKKHPLFMPFYIKPGFWQIMLFQFLKADSLLLTMIDLNVFQLKRSINPVHYIYLFHAMGSTHMVDFENSYDHYDTILCVGPHQIREIRKREQMKGLAPKNLIPHGYARVEELYNEAAKRCKPPQKPYSILLAPTWGENSILNLCGKEIVGVLLNAGFRVTLRPHYQTLKLTPKVVEEILRLYGQNPLLKYVNRMGDTDSLFDSDLLVCDWSSTSIEYALGLEKPVLYIDVPRRVRNPSYQELGLEPMEVSIRNEVGFVLKMDELEKAPLVIEKLLSDPEQFKKKISNLRENILFNFGKSVETGAREIMKIADMQKQKRLDGTLGSQNTVRNNENQ